MTIPEGFELACEIDEWRIPPCHILDIIAQQKVIEELTAFYSMTFFANLLTAVYAGNNTNTAALINSAYPGSVIYYPTVTSTSLPASVLFNASDRYVLAIEGTSGENQALLQLFSSLQGCMQFDGYDSGVYSQNVGAIIYGAIAPILLRDGLPLMIAGHSWGGSAGTVVACMIKRSGDNRWVGLTSFGSPRATGAATKALLAGNYINRICTAGDPVPYLPVHQEDVLTLIPVVGQTVATRWASFIHPREGKLLFPNGHLRSIYLSDDNLNTTLLAIIAEFLISGTLPLPSAHSLSTYLSYLS